MSELAHRLERTLANQAPERAGLGEPLLLVRDLRVCFPGSSFSLEVDHLLLRRGERIAVLGSSGSGKTTLLRAIKGLVRPERGEVSLLRSSGPLDVALGARQAPGAIRETALIYQQFNLVGRSTVYENILSGCLGRLPAWRVALGLFPRREREAAVRAAVELGLEEHLVARADRLSGGQQQRVAIARAIVQRASLVLADEPIASLDPETGAQVLDALLGAAALHGQGLLISLHDPDVACAYADRILALREGRVVFDRPASEVTPEDVSALYGRER